MDRLIWKIAGLTALAGGLTACGSDSSAPPAAQLPTTPAVAARIEDSFGAGFGTAYRADVNGMPGDPAATAINPPDPAKVETTM
jgi:hypothetical protein